MPPPRNQRNAARSGASTARGRGAAANRGKATTRQAGIKKKAASKKKRDVQPRIAAALQALFAETGFEQDASFAPQPPHARVQRVHRSNGNMCTRWSLDFVYRIPYPTSSGETEMGSLNTSEDTEILALNIMDHFMQPENAVKELKYGILHAAAFALACDLTKIGRQIYEITEAVSIRTARLWEIDASLPASALEVGLQDVKDGRVALLERRRELYPLVGEYAGELAHLAYLFLDLEGIDEEFRHLFMGRGEIGPEASGVQAADGRWVEDPEEEEYLVDWDV